MATAKRSMHVIVIIPAREVAQTIKGVLEKAVGPMIQAGIIDEVFVIDHDSKDGTGLIASACGAKVLQRTKIAAELGPSLGKGDAMWRALLATSKDSHPSDIVAFLDGDTKDPTPAHLEGLIGPLLSNEKLQMVKGCFERPFLSKNGEVRANEGGRVTELAARPLLNLHFPQLAGFSQPLAGEFAARRGLLQQLAFPVGYGIETGTLIDSLRLVGLDHLAQCDLGTRQNEHKSLRDLSSMAFAVTCTLERRLHRQLPQSTCDVACSKIFLPWEGRAKEISNIERPAIQDYLETMTAMHRPPFIDIDGVLNFRDIGGYPIKSGFVVRKGIIYRSGALTGLTHDGAVDLKRLGLKSIYDLRSQTEVDAGSAHSHRGGIEHTLQHASLVHVPVFGDQDYSPEALAQRFRDYASKGTEGFEHAYASILQNAAPALRSILDHLADSENPGPILIHCTAGKDRTGVIVMLLLLLAGCSNDTVAQEYALTETGLGVEWKAATVNRLAEHPAFKGQDHQGIQRMVGAQKDTMLAVIRNLEKDYGGVGGYLGSIGIEKTTIMKCKMVLQQHRGNGASEKNRERG